MIELITTYWPLFLVPLAFMMGARLGHAVGVNDGLRRANDIMDEVHHARGSPTKN